MRNQIKSTKKNQKEYGQRFRVLRVFFPTQDFSWFFFLTKLNNSHERHDKYKYFYCGLMASADDSVLSRDNIGKGMRNWFF